MVQETEGCTYLFELPFSYSLGKYPVVWLLDRRVVLYLIFWGTFILFSTVATTVCIPTHCSWGFPFIHILPIPVVSCAVDVSHSDRGEVIYHCPLDLHFPDDGWWWTSFHGTVGHLYFFFGEMSVHVFCLFFTWIICFLGLSRISSICFGHHPLLHMIFANIFSLWVGCLIIITIMFSLFFCCVKTFYFAVFPIVYFCFRFLCLRRQSRKMLVRSMSRSYCPPSCRIFMVSGLPLRSRNCFFVCMV